MEVSSISEAEWEIMKALWRRSPTNVNELAAELAPVRNWHRKTVRTMLNRLARKKVVGTTVLNGVFHYFPTVSREHCSLQATESLLDRVFDGALTPMVAQLVKRRPLTQAERRELMKLLKVK
jgi:BlaI family transcriptional regulator, penicillinase repressor